LHLRSLTLKGFKSFAERTKIELEPGVTVVVGPNGSGKSNIADAILWVLGEQSAKTLRGQSMEDVIFAGSSARKAVGISEVDLVLDNADGGLPLEFDEVAIARRMFRSGESEYLLSHSPARLMDIQDLLSDTGLGRDTHSIISQGRLDEILNSKPEERRGLIEEAAGILKHKKRKERSLRKLKSMDGHLDSARAIMREIERQLRPLQRQADKAKKHDVIAAELADAELALSVDHLRELQHQWDALEAREGESGEDLGLLRERLAEREDELARFQGLLEEKGLFVGDLSEQRRRLQAVLERINAGLLLLEEKGKNLVDRLSELRAKVHKSDRRLASREDELTSLAAEKAKADTRLQEHYHRLGELRKDAETVRKQRLAAQEALTEAENEATRGRAVLDDLKHELSDLENALAAHRLEEGLLEERKEQVATRAGTLTSTLAGRRGRLEQLERAVARTRKELSLAESDVDRRIRVLDDRKKDLAEASSAHGELTARIHALEEVGRAFETASPALAWILSKHADIEGLLGPVTDFIETSEEYELLVEHALGADMFCVLVRDTQAARAVLELLEREEAGEISVLSVDSQAEGPTAGTATARLLDHVSVSDEFRPALVTLLGDIVLVDSLDDALRARSSDPSLRYATRQGHLVWPSGKISLGAAVDSSAGMLARKRRLNELRDELATVVADLGSREAAVAEAEDALSAAQQDALELGQRLATQSGEHDSIRDEVGRLESELADVAVHSTDVDQRLRAVADRVARDVPAKATLATRIEKADLALEDTARLLEEKRTALDEAMHAESEMSTTLSACQVEVATVSERQVHLKRQTAAATAEVDEIRETLVQSRQTEEALELLRERIEPVHRLYSALLEQAEEWAHKLKDRADFEQTDSASLRDSVHETQDAVRELQARIEAASEGVGALQVEKGQLEVQVTTAATHIVEVLGVPLERAMETPPIEDRESAQEGVHKLKKKLSTMGPVNPVAVTEYRALDERRDFIKAQIDDLVTTREALKKVIRTIDRKMRDRFLETFEMVDGHFQDVFAVLFPGGRAALELTDPDSPSETGVEVVAQPRGKRLSRMSLMSGGEKSLVALALLFALYHTRPCPFYVLDEVDAALDDINLRRFIALVDALRDQTQFIVVTHQRRTMEMADVLYGVSMQADGVSRLVSQRLDALDPQPEEIADEHAMV
jgi:chromosome segregation protein